MLTEADRACGHGQHQVIGQCRLRKATAEVSFMEERVGLILAAHEVSVNHGHQDIIGQRVSIWRGRARFACLHFVRSQGRLGASPLPLPLFCSGKFGGRQWLSSCSDQRATSDPVKSASDGILRTKVTFETNFCNSAWKPFIVSSIAANLASMAS